MTTVYSHGAEVSGLQIRIANADDHIEDALAKQDRRAFRVWCNRRNCLRARLQRLLVEAVTGLPSKS